MYFREHINYVEEKCTKLILSLSKSAKINWGLKHEALKTIYTGGILPFLLYGAPVWKNVLNKSCYKPKLIRIQRLIYIRITKALEYILQSSKAEEKKVLVYTGSRITLQMLQNHKKHTHLIEQIRTKVIELEQDEWKVEFSWI
jgi:hypothetical protein